MNIQYRLRVYSDTRIERPEAYYRAVYGEQYSPYWDLVKVEGNCMICDSSVFNIHESDIQTKFDSITPHLYESTSSTYRILSP